MEEWKTISEYPQYKFYESGKIWSNFEQRFINGWINI